jgi:hypothetical protein
LTPLPTQTRTRSRGSSGDFFVDDRQMHDQAQALAQQAGIALPFARELLCHVPGLNRDEGAREELASVLRLVDPNFVIFKYLFHLLFFIF